MEQQPLLPVKNNIVRDVPSTLLSRRSQGWANSFLARSVNVKTFLIAACLLIAGGAVIAQSPGPNSATEADPKAPWPAAEKKGLRPKKATPQTPKNAVPPAVSPANPAAPTVPTTATPAVESSQPADFRQVPMINGIVIVNSLKEFNPDGVQLKAGLTVPNNSPLLGKAKFAQLAERFLKQPINETRMRELQHDIIVYYRDHDRPLVDVLYPEQDVSNGMLQIIVIEGRLKEVKVQDKQGNLYTNGWSGVEHLRDLVRLQTNDVISESRLVKDLDWLNRNPFRHVEAVYEPDKRDYGLTSVLLRVDEQRQWSADLGYDDSGSRITSEDRLTAGATWGKAFGLVDHQFRYAFTGDPSFELLRVHSATYYAPLPWRHGLRFSGYYLDVKGDPGSGVTIRGAAYQASARYEIPLPALGKYQHEASFGIDFKSSENNLFFNTVSIVNTPTEIFQLAAGYSSVLSDPWGQTAFGLQGYYSPGDVTGLNNDTAFNNSRTLAKASYAYARLNLERATRLPAGFTWILRGIAQISDGNLLPSEQLGLGGFATARGYAEREGNGDQGFFVSNELRSPPFSFLRQFSKRVSPEEKLQLLAFWDYGEVQNVNLLGGERPHIWLSSVGAGLRYNFTRHFSLRFDYGWQLKDTGLETPYNSRGHIGVVATY
jgi:hemolysin activation/secretion protein